MKLKEITSIGAPLLSMFILMNGAGLLNTFIPVRLEMNLVSSWDIGLVAAGYYAGMVLGAFRNAHFILRVGHIRAYATFASLTAVAVLSQGLFYDLFWWIFLRLVGGYCLSGLYIVIESWLLGKSTPQTRGQFLSLYMISLYGAMASGQFFLNLFPIDSLLPFAIITILSSLSVIPVAISKTGDPTIEEPTALSLIQLFKLSPSGIIACFCSGMVLGSVFGLVPLYLQLAIDSVTETSIIMFFLIFGGTALQYPIGHLSDRMDRRKVILGLCTIIICISFSVLFLSKNHHYAWYVLMFIFGGASFVLYPVSISHTCDVLKQNDIVAATQGLMLAYGIGAVISPALASAIMQGLGSPGLFIFFIFVSAGLFSYLIYRIQVHAPPKAEDQQEFVTLPGTTPVASEMDPRSI